MSNATAPVTSPSSSFSVGPSTAVVTVSASSSFVPSSSSASSVVLQTSLVVTSATSQQQSTAIITRTSFFTSSTPSTSSTHSSISSSSTAAVSSSPATLSSSSSTGHSSGLSPGGVTAIAVVIPVVVVALLLLAGIFWWRKRKQKKTTQEARRKEVEEYGYNPNEDPTLPAVAAGGADSPEMSEDTAGYRGWGNNPVGSNGRKPSTNLSSGIGMAVSDDGQRASPSSPGNHTTSDGGHSGDPLVDGATGAGAMMAGGAVAHQNNNNDGVQRGPSNASSSYSHTARTEASEDGANGDIAYGQNYTQYEPYRPGATQYEDTAQPVIRDVSARRNTKIENPSVIPKQGNSGISQNF